MNLGWYEIMDRVSGIQNKLEDTVMYHEVADMEVQRMIEEAQEVLSQAYTYACEQWNDSLDELLI